MIGDPNNPLEVNMAIHQEAHPLAGYTVQVHYRDPHYDDVWNFTVEDWADRIFNASWMFMNKNMACVNYAIRGGYIGLPTDNEVLYGKIAGLGFLVHTSELLPSETTPHDQDRRISEGVGDVS